MRIYLGHRLPLGFFGGIGFGRYGRPRVTHNGQDVPMHDISFWLGVIVFFVLTWFLLTSTARGQTVSPDDGHEVVITSFPDGANVWIDGVDTGKVTPMELRSIKPGQHKIAVSVAAAGWSTGRWLEH